MGPTKSLKDKFQIARLHNICDLLKGKYIETIKPEKISNKIPMKYFLNVQGPNYYFVLASFLQQVEQIKGFEYTIEKKFTVRISKIKEKVMLLGEDDDDDSYKIQPSFTV